MARDSFIFYREYKEAIDIIKDKKKKLMFYEIITEYTFYETIPENTDVEIKAIPNPFKTCGNSSLDA